MHATVKLFIIRKQTADLCLDSTLYESINVYQEQMENQ